jgi:hypothetical protein
MPPRWAAFLFPGGSEEGACAPSVGEWKDWVCNPSPLRIARLLAAQRAAPCAEGARSKILAYCFDVEVSLAASAVATGGIAAGVSPILRSMIVVDAG